MKVRTLDTNRGKMIVAAEQWDDDRQEPVGWQVRLNANDSINIENSRSTKMNSLFVSRRRRVLRTVSCIAPRVIDSMIDDPDVIYRKYEQGEQTFLSKWHTNGM